MQQQEHLYLPLLSNKDIREILDAEVTYKDDEEKNVCKSLVEELSIEDQEVIACSSYAYWIASNTTTNNNDNERNDDESDNKNNESVSTNDDDEIRTKMAMKEARRHYIGKNYSYKKTLLSLHESVQYRKEYNIDAIRTCFPSNCHPNLLFHKYKETTRKEEFHQLREKYRKLITEDLNVQNFVVRGRDNSVEKRPVVLKMKRTQYIETNNEEEIDHGFILTQLYIAERAMACAEYYAKGTTRKEEILFFFDFTDYSRTYSPSVNTVRLVGKILQAIYVERLHKFIVLHPPFWVTALWTVLKYIVYEEIRSKFSYISGSITSIDTNIQQYLDEENAMPSILSTGKLVSPFHPHQYCEDVPFHCLYDDIASNK